MSSLGTIQPQPVLPEYRCILFATDFSSVAQGALEWLKAVTKQLGSSVVLAHFKQTGGARRAGEQTIQLKAADERLQALQEEIQRIGTVASIAEFQLKYEMPFPVAAFEDQLREIIKAKDIDLIVLGTRAPAGLKRLARGSFAEGVFRHTDIPVLVVGPEAAKRTPPKSFNKVLFATDFELESIQALPVATAFAKQLGASLVLTNVCRLSRRFPNFIAWLPELLTSQEDVLKQPVDRLQRLANRFAISDATVVALHGNPEQQITRYVERESINMVVLGIRSAEYEDAVAMHIPTLVGKLVTKVSCPILTFRGKYQSHGYQVRPDSGF